jgi:cell division septum initiation protein DivIVA
MIDSSSVAGHHFLASHRRGYDPAEVDAVIKRLVATLRKYEEREEARNATATVTDIAQARNARPLSGEHTDGRERLHDEAGAEIGRAQHKAEAVLADAHDEAEQVLETARAEAAGLLARRHERSEALITSALSEVKALRARTLSESNDYRDATRAEAASLLHTAELQAEQILEEARHEAGTILGRARREHADLERRLAQLRSAVSEIQGQFRSLAATTLEQTEIMASMIALESEPLEDVLEEATPEVVRLTPQKTTVDLTGDQPETERNPRDDRFAVGPGETIYQRRAILRRRLEEEEVPELDAESATDPH